MELFDKLGEGHDIALTAKAALLLSAITMTAIDGVIDDDEIAIINRLDGSGTNNSWDLAIKIWDMKSVDECISLITESLDQKQQLVAMANMIDIAMADGFLVSAEKKLLEAYAASFSVTDSDIEKIIHVISIKNDRSLF